MKKIISSVLVLLFSLQAAALDGAPVKYVGGTTANLTAGSVGSLDIASTSSLAFKSAGGTIEIPYVDIDSYQSTQEVAHHLGVLPAIAIGLLMARHRLHFIRITYHDQQDDRAKHVVILELPKDMQRTVEAVLEARASHHRQSPNSCACGRGTVPCSPCDSRETVPGTALQPNP